MRKDWTTEDWCAHYSGLPEHETRLVLTHPKIDGNQRAGAEMAQQVREDQRRTREEERHRESMSETRRAMSWGR